MYAFLMKEMTSAANDGCGELVLRADGLIIAYVRNVWGI